MNQLDELIHGQNQGWIQSTIQNDAHKKLLENNVGLPDPDFYKSFKDIVNAAGFLFEDH